MVLVIRKSSDSSRSSLPVGAGSRQTTSRGRAPDGACVARRLESVPSRWCRKYSSPLPDEPSRFARQTVSTRGKFSGASGSSAANRSRPARSSRGTCSPTGAPAAATSSARSSGLRSNVGYDGIQPMRADFAMTSAVVSPANGPPVPGVAADRVSALNGSYRNWSLCRYQYAVWIIVRGGRAQSFAVEYICWPVDGRTFSCPT